MKKNKSRPNPTSRAIDYNNHYCKICAKNNKQYFCINRRSLGNHLMRSHKPYTIEKYTLEFYFNGEVPKCLCGNCLSNVGWHNTEYWFNDYISGHNPGGFTSTNQPILTPEQRSIVNKKSVQTTLERKGKDFFKVISALAHLKIQSDKDAYIKKLSDGQLRSWENLERRRKLIERNREFIKQGIIGFKFITEEDFALRSKILEIETGFRILATYDEYKSAGGTHGDIQTECVKCRTRQLKTIGNLTHNICACINCKKQGSIGSNQLHDFLLSLNISAIRNDRTILGPNETYARPREIDHLIPAKKFGIEYNGLWYHCEVFRDEYYHQNKTLDSEKEGITLFHIFEDEWLEKQEIIKSMIKNKLGLSEKTIYGRDCEIVPIETNLAVDFLKKNHISGPGIFCKENFGLFYNDELVSVMAFRLPTKQNSYPKTIELYRFASLINTNIAGGFSKLLSYASKHFSKSKFEKILSYCDVRFSNGNVYKENGFEFIGFQKNINYWYTDGTKRFSRETFKKREDITEEVIASEHRVFKIWGAGNKKFIKSII